MLVNGLAAEQVRKKILACNRKRKRLAASIEERLTELSKQRKQIQLLWDSKIPIATNTYVYYHTRDSAQCDS